MAGLKRIFGNDGIVPRRKAYQEVSKEIDAEAQRVAAKFEGYMPSDVESLFMISLRMHLTLQALDRKSRAIRIAKGRAKKR